MNNEDSVLANAEVQVIQNVMISRYFTAAGSVVVIYDTILTIKDEIRLVWPGPFAASKLFYYINRYWTIATLIVGNYHMAGFRPQLPTAFCQNSILVGAIVILIVELASAGILILRVTALYDGGKWVGRGLWIIWVLLYAIAIGVSSISIKSFNGQFVYDPLAGVCLPADMTFKTYAAFVIPAVFDVIILTLTALKTYRFAAVLRKQSGSAILYIMLRDGILYFTIVVLLRIWNAVIWVALPHSFMYLGIYAFWAILSTMTSRIFLNLRSAGLKSPRDPQAQSPPDFPLGSRRAAPPEFVQAASDQGETVGNFDTDLFAMASSAEGNAFGNLDGLLSRNVPEPKPDQDNPEVDK